MRGVAVDRRVDAVRRTLDLPFSGQLGAVVADFHQAAGGHFGPVQAERNLVVAVVRAGHAEGEVVENPLIQAMHHREAMRGGEVHPRLPAHGFDIEILGLQRFQRHWVHS